MITLVYLYGETPYPPPPLWEWVGDWVGDWVAGWLAGWLGGWVDVGHVGHFEMSLKCGIYRDIQGMRGGYGLL